MKLIQCNSLLKSFNLAGLLITFLSFLPLNLSAQTAPAKQWDKTFGGSGGETLSALQQTVDGGYILGGHSSSDINGDKSQASQGNYDYWIVKIDNNGNKTWDKTFGSALVDNFGALQQTSDGGYILGGWSSSWASGDKSENSKGKRDYWIVKTDNSGNKLWDKTFGGTEDDHLTSIVEISGGGYILGGDSKSDISGDKSQTSNGNTDYWLIKLDIYGNKIWDKSYGGSGYETFREIHQTSDGGFILGGISGSGIGGDKTQAAKGNGDYWIVKIDNNGTKLWDKTFGGNAFDQFHSLQQTTDGGYILAGDSYSGISGDKSEANKGVTDYWVVKLDANGNKEWDKSFGGSKADIPLAVKQTNDGGYILGGCSESGISGDKSEAFLGGESDYWIVKINNFGNKIWDKAFGGSSRDYLTALQQTIDGGFILGGHSDSGISIDKSHNSKGADDYWIVKLGPEILSTPKPQPTFHLSISPNPNQGKFKLQLSNLKPPTTQVTITDMLGRVILQQQLPVTDQQLTEELEIKAAKGMYVVQVKAGDEMLTRKIVVE